MRCAGIPGVIAKTDIYGTDKPNLNSYRKNAISESSVDSASVYTAMRGRNLLAPSNNDTNVSCLHIPPAEWFSTNVEILITKQMQHAMTHLQNNF